MQNRKLSHTLAGAAATLLLAGGSWAATGVHADAAQRQNADAAGGGGGKSIRGSDFSSSGQQAWKSDAERKNADLARRMAGQTASNGYRADAGRGVPDSQSRSGIGGAADTNVSRGGCGKPCGKQ